MQENEKRHEMDQQVERRRRQREQQATRRARSGDIPRDSSRPVLCSHGRPKVCCLYVYASVCLVRISSETAGRIWLKFYAGRTYVHSRTLSRILVAIVQGSRQRSRKRGILKSGRHWRHS